MSHFFQTAEEALQATLRYEFIYAQSCYVYIVILDFPYLGGANALGAFHAIGSLIGTLSHPSPHT